MVSRDKDSESYLVDFPFGNNTQSERAAKGKTSEAVKPLPVESYNPFRKKENRWLDF